MNAFEQGIAIANPAHINSVIATALDLAAAMFVAPVKINSYRETLEDILRNSLRKKFHLRR